MWPPMFTLMGIEYHTPAVSLTAYHCKCSNTGNKILERIIFSLINNNNNKSDVFYPTAIHL